MAKKIDWTKPIEFVDTKYGTILEAEVVAVVGDGSRVIEYSYPRTPVKMYSLICNENGTVVGSSARGLRDYRIRNKKPVEKCFQIEWKDSFGTSEDFSPVVAGPFISGVWEDSEEDLRETYPPEEYPQQTLHLCVIDGRIVKVNIVDKD